MEQREEFSCNAVLYAVAAGGTKTMVVKNEAAVTYSYVKTPKISGTSARFISWRGNE